MYKYNQMSMREFIESIIMLYGELEIKGLEEDKTEYPLTMWLADLYDLIIEHKEEI